MRETGPMIMMSKVSGISKVTGTSGASGSGARDDADAGGAAERIPVYRAGALTGYVRRGACGLEAGGAMEARGRGLSADARLHRDIEAAMRSEMPKLAEDVRLSVEDGVVTLSGAVETVHDKMALQRIAASMKASAAIVDEIWISCE